jgi:hypothetical protein
MTPALLSCEVAPSTNATAVLVQSGEILASVNMLSMVLRSSKSPLASRFDVFRVEENRRKDRRVTVYEMKWAYSELFAEDQKIRRTA